jgi:hypothetical protein
LFQSQKDKNNKKFLSWIGLKKDVNRNDLIQKKGESEGEREVDQSIRFTSIFCSCLIIYCHLFREKEKGNNKTVKTIRCCYQIKNNSFFSLPPSNKTMMDDQQLPRMILLLLQSTNNSMIEPKHFWQHQISMEFWTPVLMSIQVIGLVYICHCFLKYKERKLFVAELFVGILLLIRQSSFYSLLEFSGKTDSTNINVDLQWSPTSCLHDSNPDLCVMENMIWRIHIILIALYSARARSRSKELMRKAEPYLQFMKNHQLNSASSASAASSSSEAAAASISTKPADAHSTSAPAASASSSSSSQGAVAAESKPVRLQTREQVFAFKALLVERSRHCCSCHPCPCCFCRNVVTPEDIAGCARAHHPACNFEIGTQVMCGLMIVLQAAMALLLKQSNDTAIAMVTVILLLVFVVLLDLVALWTDCNDYALKYEHLSIDWTEMKRRIKWLIGTELFVVLAIAFELAAFDQRSDEQAWAFHRVSVSLTFVAMSMAAASRASAIANTTTLDEDNSAMSPSTMTMAGQKGFLSPTPVRGIRGDSVPSHRKVQKITQQWSQMNGNNDSQQLSSSTSPTSYANMVLNSVSLANVYHAPADAKSDFDPSTRHELMSPVLGDVIRSWYGTGVKEPVPISLHTAGLMNHPTHFKGLHFHAPLFALRIINSTIPLSMLYNWLLVFKKKRNVPLNNESPRSAAHKSQSRISPTITHAAGAMAPAPASAKTSTTMDSKSSETNTVAPINEHEVAIDINDTTLTIAETDLEAMIHACELIQASSQVCSIYNPMGPDLQWWWIRQSLNDIAVLMAQNLAFFTNVALYDLHQACTMRRDGLGELLTVLSAERRCESGSRGCLDPPHCTWNVDDYTHLLQLTMATKKITDETLASIALQASQLATFKYNSSSSSSSSSTSPSSTSSSKRVVLRPTHVWTLCNKVFTQRPVTDNSTLSRCSEITTLTQQGWFTWLNKFVSKCSNADTDAWCEVKSADASKIVDAITRLNAEDAYCVIRQHILDGHLQTSDLLTYLTKDDHFLDISICSVPLHLALQCLLNVSSSSSAGSSVTTVFSADPLDFVEHYDMDDTHEDINFNEQLESTSIFEIGDVKSLEEDDEQEENLNGDDKEQDKKDEQEDNNGRDIHLRLMSDTTEPSTTTTTMARSTTVAGGAAREGIRRGPRSSHRSRRQQREPVVPKEDSSEILLREKLSDSFTREMKRQKFAAADAMWLATDCAWILTKMNGTAWSTALLTQMLRDSHRGRQVHSRLTRLSGKTAFGVLRREFGWMMDVKQSVVDKKNQPAIVAAVTPSITTSPLSSVPMPLVARDPLSLSTQSTQYTNTIFEILEKLKLHTKTGWLANVCAECIRELRPSCIVKPSSNPNVPVVSDLMSKPQSAASDFAAIAAQASSPTAAAAAAETAAEAPSQEVTPAIAETNNDRKQNSALDMPVVPEITVFVLDLLNQYMALWPLEICDTNHSWTAAYEVAVFEWVRHLKIKWGFQETPQHSDSKTLKNDVGGRAENGNRAKAAVVNADQKTKQSTRESVDTDEDTVDDDNNIDDINKKKVADRQHEYLAATTFACLVLGALVAEAEQGVRMATTMRDWMDDKMLFQLRSWIAETKIQSREIVQSTKGLDSTKLAKSIFNYTKFVNATLKVPVHVQNFWSFVPF